ncbi:MAG: antibiotic biosynthesis monooxygenase [Deltaproteobacteria bacterium]|nr:antibiotic biosynthesis monooxygenase [Deltaproteobacteria bacterium]
MILVTNRLQVSQGFEDELVERFEKRAGQVETEPGFVQMVVLRHVSRRKNLKQMNGRRLQTNKFFKSKPGGKTKKRSGIGPTQKASAPLMPKKKSRDILGPGDHGNSRRRHRPQK